MQGSKKVPCSRPGRVDSPGQVAFLSYLPNGQGIRQVVCQLSKLRLAQGKQNSRATCPKGKLECKFFSNPDCLDNSLKSHTMYLLDGPTVSSTGQLYMSCLYSVVSIHSLTRSLAHCPSCPVGRRAATGDLYSLTDSIVACCAQWDAERQQRTSTAVCP